MITKEQQEVVEFIEGELRRVSRTEAEYCALKAAIALGWQLWDVAAYWSAQCKAAGQAEHP